MMVIIQPEGGSIQNQIINLDSLASCASTTRVNQPVKGLHHPVPALAPRLPPGLCFRQLSRVSYAMRLFFDWNVNVFVIM